MNLEQQFIELKKRIIKRDFARMNDMQFEAVVSVNGPLLILAGAGSGKTTVLINRIVNMLKYGNAYNSDAPYATEEDIIELTSCVENDLPAPSWMGVDVVRPWEVLAITFTNKAARELKERLDAAVGAGGADVWAATFHSTCARILRRHADRLGFSNNFTIYATDEQRRLMKDIMKSLDIDEKILGHRAILTEISHAKDSLISPKEYEASTAGDIRRKMVSDAYRKYQEILNDYDAMDFDDLICNTVKLFNENPDVLDYYQNRFKYIMIDEYQDTNHAQYMFAKLLAAKHENICVVGDDDQSIYRFRGATIENILSFEKQYLKAKVIRLEQNYRSTQIILDAANAVIKNNRGRKGKNLWTEQLGGDKITLYNSVNEQSEARYIVDTITENINSGAKPSDHAVLYRMNAQSNAIENVLMRSGISYRVVGGMKFFDRKEIRDVIAYLNVVNNPSDGVALRRIVNEPKRGIGDTTMSNVVAIAEQTGERLLEIMARADEFAILSRSASKLKDFTAMIEDFTDNVDKMELHELLEYILDKSGYMSALAVSGDDAQDRIDNVNEFSSNVVQYENENRENGVTLSGFLEEIALITDLDTEDSEIDRVLLMTMHTAKGLEFPYVFIAGMEEGIFPGNQSIYGTEDDIEEERRLAYVGITRAKKRLYLSNATSRMLFGRTERSRPSRFLAEIPDRLIELKKEPISFSSYGSFSGFGGSFNTNDSRAYNNTVPKQGNAAERNYNQRTSFAKSPSRSSDKNYEIGQRVKHKAFGEGLIISAVPMANDTMLEIAFDKVGTKRIMSNFAKLEII